MDKLRFDNVSLSYTDADAGADPLHALANASFAVGAGESVALIGPSGCGKSSTLQLACGLVEPTSGEVLVDGERVCGTRHKTALVLQGFGLLPWKSVLANAELGLKVRGVAPAERRERAMQALELVGLSDFADAYPSGLSGGMQQRLAMARALALSCDLLLLDEPLSALDALLREQLQDTLVELWRAQGYAQLLVTHSIDEAVYLGQRIMVMAPRPGRIVEVIDNADAGDRAYRASSAFFAKATQVREALRAASGEGPDA